MERLSAEDFAEMRDRRDVVRPPSMRSPPALPRGPRLYRVPRNLGYKGPVAEPPPGFIGGQNSRYEWMVYHALSKVFGYPTDPRLPPFIGQPGVWTYQKAWDEGRREIGGSVIDFVVYSGSKSDFDIAFRVQTEFFHLYTDIENQVHDLMQMERLSAFMRVVDLYDQDFAWDETNAATVALIKDALAGRTFANPINGGTTERVTRQRTISV